MGERIGQARKSAGMKQRQLAARIGVSAPAVSQWESGGTEPERKNLQAIAAVCGVSLEWLMTGLNGDGTPWPSQRQDTIPEIDVRAGMGGGGEVLVAYVPDKQGEMTATDATRGHWSLPSDYLRSELRILPQAARIIEVQGDSMEPTLLSGDRVIVDTTRRLPSPPGIFALWDGFGVVVKRLEHIPNSTPPRVVIKSDNNRHGEYERTLEEVSIIGRVVWNARRL